MIGLINPPGSRAQSQAAPAFEVASIKPTGRSGRPIRGFSGGPGTNNPGQLTVTNLALGLIIQRAYNVRPWLLVGPAWLNADRWDIIAKIPPGAPKEQFNLMLQSLLAERFGLVVHRETRELPIYELVVAKGGSRLKEAKEPAGGAQYGPSSGTPVRTAMLPKDKDGWPVLPPGAEGIFPSMSGGNYRWSFRIQPIAELKAMLEREGCGRPVVDKTGLTGTCSFDLTFGEDNPRDASQSSAGEAGLREAASEPGTRPVRSGGRGD